MHISRSIFGIFLQLNIPTCSTHRELSKNALKSVTLWNTYKKIIFVEVGVEMVTLPLDRMEEESGSKKGGKTDDLKPA